VRKRFVKQRNREFELGGKRGIKERYSLPGRSLLPRRKDSCSEDGRGGVRKENPTERGLSERVGMLKIS